MIKVIRKEWRSGLNTVGFIAYETGSPVTPGEWCAVVGYRPESIAEQMSSTHLTTAEYDAKYIAENGCKLSYKEAEVFFPGLDITKYKYYPETLKNN